MTIPLHGKRSYVRIRKATLSGFDPLTPLDLDSSWQVVSFATGFSFDLEQQNISRAIVMGTDGILDIESHGLLAIGNVDMILNDGQEVIISAFGDTIEDASNLDGSGVIELDYNKKIDNAIAGINFDGAVKIDMQVMPLTAYEDFSASIILATTRSQYGYVFTIEDATLRSLRIRGSAGNYVTSALQVEGGRLRISQKKKA